MNGGVERGRPPAKPWPRTRASPREALPGGGVARLALLDGAKCEEVAGRVLALRAHWESRWPSLPFYTLGAASYLDSSAGARERYYSKAAARNPLLEREFGWLYGRLLKALGEWLGAPARFVPDAARPGFHIFLAHEIFRRRPLSKFHFDIQYENLDWSGRGGIDFSRPLSFTLAVRLPRSGAGLTTSNIAKADYDAMDAAARARLHEECPPRYEAYREGEMACHSGLLLHRIARARGRLHPGDMRLTLQGHALPGREGYWLYW